MNKAHFINVFVSSEASVGECWDDGEQTDGQGNIVERMAYTAFGQRRKGDWRASDPLLPIIPALTNRGFTDLLRLQLLYQPKTTQPLYNLPKHCLQPSHPYNKQ
jgi:hypothetical protein